MLVAPGADIARNFDCAHTIATQLLLLMLEAVWLEYVGGVNDTLGSIE